MLGSVLRLLATTISARHLANEHEEPTDERSGRPLADVEDPWDDGDPAVRKMTVARLLGDSLDALAAREDVPALLRGIRALDVDDARGVILERAIAKMIRQGRPQSPSDIPDQ